MIGKNTNPGRNIRKNGSIVGPRSTNSKNNHSEIERVELNKLNILKKIYEKPIIPNSDEYLEARSIVCRIYHTTEDEWWTVIEIEDVIYDIRRRIYNLVPIHSVTYGKRNNEIPKKNITVSPNSTGLFLPENIALNCECKSDYGWERYTVSIMKTIGDFWKIVNYISGYTTGSSNLFISSLKDKEQDADSIFKNLVSFGKKYDRKRICEIISQYNTFHPIWAFIKVNEQVSSDNNIVIPYIRVNDRAINDININIRGVYNNDLYEESYIIDDDFSTGFISRLVLSLAGGTLPDNICAVVFNKTIVINNNRFYKGYRVRVVINSVKYLEKCKEFLENRFLEEHSLLPYRKYFLFSLPKI